MVWIEWLEVLFKEMSPLKLHKQACVERDNYMNSLTKVKNLMPLEHPQKFFERSGDVALKYCDVFSQLEKYLPVYPSFDNILDALLVKSI
jgi:F420-dependent methylenetetrahydromethanopterin dehydrogenase